MLNLPLMRKCLEAFERAGPEGYDFNGFEFHEEKICFLARACDVTNTYFYAARDLDEAAEKLGFGNDSDDFYKAMSDINPGWTVDFDIAVSNLRQIIKDEEAKQGETNESKSPTSTTPDWNAIACSGIGSANVIKRESHVCNQSSGP